MFQAMYKVFLPFLVFILISVQLDSEAGQTKEDNKMLSPIEWVESQWVDSLMQVLTLEEKVAQLFMIAVYSNKSESYNREIIQLISKYQIGGVIFMQGGPIRQAKLYNELQANVTIPLMVGMDAEHGLAMRLDSTVAYPKAMTIGAVQNEQLVYEFGQELANQCNRLGVHINFAPVVDVNSNPKNPIINIRSYGENKNNVSRKGLAYGSGMQSNKVMAVCKHFPGHGDTNSDSHKTLPTVGHSIERINSVELQPFQSIINNGIGGVMVAHLSVPAINNGQTTPVSLSSQVIDSLLKNKLGFKGLVFTDALNMKGVTRDFELGEIEVKALLAGNDVLLFPEDVELGISAVIAAVKDSVIPLELINDKCQKILKAKDWFGLQNFKKIEVDGLIEDLNSKEAKLVQLNLFKDAITKLGDDSSILPLGELENRNILSITIGAKNNIYQKMLTKYTKVDTITLVKNFTIKDIQKVIDTARHYNTILISKHNTNNSVWRKYGTSLNDLRLLSDLSKSNDVVFSYFGNPYGLKSIIDSCQFRAVLVAYQDLPVTNSYVAQAIFGGVAFNGKLPVSINENFKVGEGEGQRKVRIGYSMHDTQYLPDSTFFQADSIITDAMLMKATPGCQVIYAKAGEVLFSRNYGYYTYQKDKLIDESSIYDLASVTKLVSTTLSMMKLYESDQINITAKLSNYLEELDLKGKRKIRIDDLMAHQAKFHSWIPFYRQTLDEAKKPRADLYKHKKEPGFDIQISANMFMRNDYVDSVYQTILDTPIYKSKKYRYSDLGFYWLAKLVESKSEQLLQHFVQSSFYQPLGMDKTSYLPLLNHGMSEIVPSEKDNYFRNELVQGFVHDPGCAMVGGVSGHAGVFSNANDLLKLGQMLLNEGYYGGVQFFEPSTIDVFTKSRFKRKGNRRAMGFDKPALKVGDPGPTCESASQESFGHSGFTGTYFWVDPKDQSIYIFLSNRTFPNQNNNKLVKNDIRTKIQQAFYDISH